MTDRCSLRTVARPEISEVHAALQEWGGVVVHFSGVPPGVTAGLGLSFPDDLRHVINGHAQGGVSCSTVRPRDVFEGPHRNSWGCIGVIVRGRSPWSLVCVDRSDCGSFMGCDGLRNCAQANSDLTIEHVVLSLQGRSVHSCNEWVMRDYEVLGVLVQPPFSVRVLGDTATRCEIVTAFPDQRLFTIMKDGLFEVSQDFEITRALPISELYPT